LLQGSRKLQSADIPTESAVVLGEGSGGNPTLWKKIPVHIMEGNPYFPSILEALNFEYKLPLGMSCFCSKKTSSQANPWMSSLIFNHV
jgi:hypothetical protein